MEQVYRRLQTPLLTLMSASTPEIAFCVLKHVALLVDRVDGLFLDEYKQFFCKYDDPSSVQSVKISIMPRLADDSNASSIVAELTEYVVGVDDDLARAAVHAIGQVRVCDRLQSA